MKRRINMSNIRKKIIAIMLAVGFCITSIPSAAIASEQSIPVEDDITMESPPEENQEFTEQPIVEEPVGTTAQASIPAEVSPASMPPTEAVIPVSENSAVTGSTTSETTTVQEGTAAEPEGTTTTEITPSSEGSTTSSGQTSTPEITENTSSEQQYVAENAEVVQNESQSNNDEMNEIPQTGNESSQEEQNTVTVYNYEDQDVRITATLNEAEPLVEGMEFFVVQLSPESEVEEERTAYSWAEELLNQYLNEPEQFAVNPVYYDMYFAVNGSRITPNKPVHINIEYKNYKAIDPNANESNVWFFRMDDTLEPENTNLYAVQPYLETSELDTVIRAEYDVEQYRYTPLIISMLENKEEHETRLAAEEASQNAENDANTENENSGDETDVETGAETDTEGDVFYTEDENSGDESGTDENVIVMTEPGEDAGETPSETIIYLEDPENPEGTTDAGTDTDINVPTDDVTDDVDMTEQENPEESQGEDQEEGLEESLEEGKVIIQEEIPEESQEEIQEEIPEEGQEETQEEGKEENQEEDQGTRKFITDEVVNTESEEETVTDGEADGSEAEDVEKEDEKEAENKEENKDEAADEDKEEAEVPPTRTYYASLKGDVSVTVILTDPTQVPDSAEIVVTAVTPDASDYNYDAYLEALNNNPDSNITYTPENTLLYDISFVDHVYDEEGDLIDTIVYEPAEGTVKVQLRFNENQLSNEIKAENSEDVTVNHLVTDAEADTTALSADEIEVDPVDANVNLAGTDSVSFSTESFSVYAFTYTVDFHYEINGQTVEFSIPGGGFVSLEHIVEVLGIARNEENDASVSENATIEDVNALENDVNNGTEQTDVDENDANIGTYEESINLNNLEVSEATKKFVADVESVVFSSPELVWVGKVDHENTVGGLKEVNGLQIEYSANLTEEQITEINAQIVKAGDWALISVLPFTSEESLTVTMTNGDQFTVKVTDAQIRRLYLSARGSLYEVTVTYGSEAKIPDGATLQITEYDEASEEYQYVRKTVLGEEEDIYYSEVAEEVSTDSEDNDTEVLTASEKPTETIRDTVSDTSSEMAMEETSNTISEDIEVVAEKELLAEGEGVSTEAEDTSDADAENSADAMAQETALEALDITILDQDGQAIEPEGPVELQIVMKSLPQDLDLFQDTVTVQHLDVSSGEVQVETVADTEGTGKIYISDNTAIADFTLDSFSQFAITYTYTTYWQTTTYVTVNVHYVDVEGKELSGRTNGVNITNNTELILGTYKDRMTQSGYTYLGAHYGTYSGQNITSLKATNAPSTGSLITSGQSVTFYNGSTIVARQEYESSMRQVDVYLVYAPTQGYYIKDTIGEDGCLTVCNGTDAIQTGTDQNLFVKWYRSSNASDYELVTQSKILNGTYNIPELDGPKVNVAIDEGADQYYKAVIYKVENNEEVELSTTEPYHVPYYDDVRNGNFETPHNDGFTNESINKWPSNWQVENGMNGVIWKTTGTAKDNSKRDIEIPQGAAANGTGANNLGETLRNYCFAFMPEGNQCAELNCEASGALYQDVLTIPGSQMYWSLYHRARGGYDKWKEVTDKTKNTETDTMYVVAMSKDLAEKYDVTTQEKVLAVLKEVNNPDSEFHDVEIVKITTTNGGNGTMEFLNSGFTLTVPATYFGNLATGGTAQVYDSGTGKNFTYGNTDWHYYTGNFSIPENQYLTRFFFVAGNTASGNSTMGNFLDDIKLSDSVPSPNYGQASVIIQKTVEGLGVLPDTYATRIETTYTVTENNSIKNSYDKNSDYDQYRTVIAPDGSSVSTASWTFPITIGNGQIIAFTEGRETAPENEQKTDQIEGYTQMTSWILRKQNGSQTVPEIIAQGSGKVVPAEEMAKLTVTEKDVIYIEFINTYTPKQKISICKTDSAGNVISTGASFNLFKAEDYNDETEQAKEGVNPIVYGTTNEHGILYLGELEEGSYRLVETDAPNGYILFDKAIQITITADNVAATQGNSASNILVSGDDGWQEGQDIDTKQIQVWNKPGVTLPNTGGHGTRLFTLLGSIMILGGSALLGMRGYKRRKSRQN